MARYRFLAADLLTGTIREEIPFSTASFSHVLNRPGAFEGGLGLRHAKATRANLDPGRTAIHVERDGLIAWSGILWTVRAQATAATLQVAAEGWWSYFRRRFVRTTKTYAAVDQLAIARDLIDYAQSEPDGDVGVVVGFETSGVLRDRTYPAFERKNIGDAVEQLAAVENGFDFAIEAAWLSGVVTKTLRLSYPRRGRVTNLVFELDANLEELNAEVDAARQANRIDTVGAGDGAATLFATATAAVASGFPLLEDVVAFKDVTVAATLQAHADLAVTNRQLPVERLPMLVAHQANPDTRFGAFTTGDTIRVRANAGWLNVDDLMRVQEIRVEVDPDGRERVGLAFVPEEASL